MFISNSRKFIYFHIPKSAGTSISELLARGMAWNDICIGGCQIGEFYQKYWTPIFKLDKHSHPLWVKSLVGDEVFTSYFKFAFLRDPLDRFRSAAHFIVQSVREERAWALEATMIQTYKAEIMSFQSLADVLQSDFYADCKQVPQWQAGDIVKLFQPQANYFHNRFGRRIDGMTCFSLNHLASSLETLKGMDLITQDEVDQSQILNHKRNVSAKLLVDDFQDDHVHQLKSDFERDYQLLADRSG